VLNLRDLTFGTERYQFVSPGTSGQHDSAYRLSIEHHGTTLHDETMLRQLSDRKEVVSIAGATSSTNLGASIDRRVRGSQ
jgi:hypothetical protein